MITAYLSDKWFKDHNNYQRLSLSFKLPRLITEPGQYLSRCGEIITITDVTDKYAFGTYPNGVKEHWDLTGRIWFNKECDNDIIEKAQLIVP
jgi:hypothetical protein